MKKHAFRIGLVVTMLLGLMMISANAANCACDGAHTHAADDGWVAMDQAAAQALFGGDKQTLTANAKYYLTEHVTVTNESANKGIVELGEYTFDLCLNGKTMDFDVTNAKTNGIFVVDGASAQLNIHDCVGTGSISNTDSQTATTAVKLAGVKNGGTFDLYGGTIKDFYSSYGVVQLVTGNFNIHGGTVNNITAGSGQAKTKGFFNFHSGTNSVTISGGTFDTGTPLFCSNATSGSTLNISGGTFITGGFGNVGSYDFAITGGSFAADVFVDKVAAYVNQETHKVTEKKVGDVTYKTVESRSTSSEVELIAELAANELKEGNYYLGADGLTLEKTLVISGVVTLDLKGATLTSTASPAIEVSSGAILSLKDSSETDTAAGTGTIKPAASTTSQGIKVVGKLNMTGGIIDGFNSGSISGAGMVVSGEFNMSGGAIQNCTTTGKNGGGILTQGGTVKISGEAVLTGNTAGENGGAIASTSAGGTITIEGGEIYGNSASVCGAAIYLNTATLTVTDGNIYGNKGTHSIYNAKTGAVTIEDGNFGLNAEKNAVETEAKYVLYDERGAVTTISGGNFCWPENGSLLDLSDTNAAAGTKTTITGGNMSGYVDDYLVDESDPKNSVTYFCYELADRVADKSPTPYQVGKKISADVKLTLSNKNGFFVRFEFDSPYKVNGGKNFTIEWNGGSKKELSTTNQPKTLDRWIAAKDMFNPVTLTIKNGDKEAYTATFTVKDYAEVLLSDENTQESEKKALADMLRYGDAAQAYFTKGNTGLADSVKDITGSTWSVPEADPSNLAADTNHLYQGSALVLKNDIDMNLYFDKNVTAVTVNGADVQLSQTGNGYQEASYDISLQNATKTLEITMTAGGETITVKDSIEAYAFRAQNLTPELKAENGALLDLCQAMMNFVTSADAHFNPAS